MKITVAKNKKTLREVLFIIDSYNHNWYIFNKNLLLFKFSSGGR